MKTVPNIAPKKRSWWTKDLWQTHISGTKQQLPQHQDGVKSLKANISGDAKPVEFQCNIFSLNSFTRSLKPNTQSCMKRSKGITTK